MRLADMIFKWWCWEQFKCCKWWNVNDVNDVNGARNLNTVSDKDNLLINQIQT